MPEFKVDSVVDEVTNAVRDAFYVTVGLAVIAFQRAQVQRQELRKQLESQLGDAREQVQRAGRGFEDRFKVIEERLEAVEDRFESLVDQFEDRLPEQAKELVKQAREAAKEARGQLRGLTGRPTTAAAA